MSKFDKFISKWSKSGGNERANAIPFLYDLCKVIGVKQPKPAVQSSANVDYRFERYIRSWNFGESQKGYIDLYKKGCFIIETKQGINAVANAKEAQSVLLQSVKGSLLHGGHGMRSITPNNEVSNKTPYDEAIVLARGQAYNYARALASEDGWVPFIIVCDVGSRFDIYADFSGKGYNYVQFPDPENFRIHLDDLKKPGVQERLKRIWTDPYSLNPELQQTKVTKNIANQLALLCQSLEEQGYSTKDVINFLMRFVFSMFAENVLLIPDQKFSRTLIEMKNNPQNIHLVLNDIWQAMNEGNFSLSLLLNLKKFNGGLFKEVEKPIKLNQEQVDLLIHATKFSWKDVEPAIFGSLLERALDQNERYKLGAHYTPRSYVERLVIPTVIDPLRTEWDMVQVMVSKHMKNEQTQKALQVVRTFHKKLCEIKVLDPACGSGNFLYVTFEHLKIIEGEVTAQLEDLGDNRKKLSLAGQTVDPSQFLGIEINPWAASIAKLVLWIGYLQQQYRIFGNVMPAEPVLRDFKNIEHRDAILEWDSKEVKLDKTGKTVKQWDGATYKTNPTTGEEVPDSKALVPVYKYTNPRPAEWPDADYIVGNPPFIGDKLRRVLLSDAYTEALGVAYKHIAPSADFVMYWWDISARKVRDGDAECFGLITTSGITHEFNQRVVEKYLNDSKSPLSIKFAIPDHPWVDDAESAKVRIAMTTCMAGESKGSLSRVITDEEPSNQDIVNASKIELSSEVGKINSRLTIGPDISKAVPLMANKGISSLGLMLAATNLKITEEKAVDLGMKAVTGLDSYIKPLRRGSDLAQFNKNLYVIDLFGLSSEEVSSKFPSLYQHLLDKVKPERDVNKRKSLRVKWWLPGETRPGMRSALEGLDRYIVTLETSKHRFFQFLPANIRPDHSLIAIASDDAAHLTILSSRIHALWADQNKGARGATPVYNKSNSFDKFPFPELNSSILSELRELGEQLHLQRTTQFAQFPKLTMSAMYTVLDKFRSKVQLTDAEQKIYDWGLIPKLDKIHNKIDIAVAKAFGWTNSLSDDEITTNLIELNKNRVNHENNGNVVWFRPDFQDPGGLRKADAISNSRPLKTVQEGGTKREWPKSINYRLIALMDVLFELQEATPKQLANQFINCRVKTVENLLSMLEITSAVIATGTGTYISKRKEKTN